MRHKAIMLHAHGLRCDANACPYTQDEPRGNDYNDWAKWLNKPCPRCGANLLTQADLNTMGNLLKFIHVLNIILWPVAWLCYVLGLKKVNVDLGMDGTGKINPRMRMEPPCTCGADKVHYTSCPRYKL